MLEEVPFPGMAGLSSTVVQVLGSLQVPKQTFILGVQSEV